MNTSTNVSGEQLLQSRRRAVVMEMLDANSRSALLKQTTSQTASARKTSVASMVEVDMQRYKHLMDDAVDDEMEVDLWMGRTNNAVFSSEGFANGSGIATPLSSLGSPDNSVHAEEVEIPSHDNGQAMMMMLDQNIHNGSRKAFVESMLDDRTRNFIDHLRSSNQQYLVDEEDEDMTVEYGMDEVTLDGMEGCAEVRTVSSPIQRLRFRRSAIVEEALDDSTRSYLRSVRQYS